MLNTCRTHTTHQKKDKQPTGCPVGFPVGAPTLVLNRPSVLGHRLLGSSVCRHQQSANCGPLHNYHTWFSTWPVPLDRQLHRQLRRRSNRRSNRQKSYAPQATHHKTHPPSSSLPPVASARTSRRTKGITETLVSACRERCVQYTCW